MRQAHIICGEFRVYLFAEAIDILPLHRRVRPGDARVFVDARHRHRKIEFRFARIDLADDGGGAGRRRRAGQRNMAFTGEQPGGRVQSDPARAGNVGFGPRMQIGEVMRRTGRAIQRFNISGQLNQIARNKARRHTAVAQQLHQQPAAVAARAAGQREGLFTRLHARFHSD